MFKIQNVLNLENYYFENCFGFRYSIFGFVLILDNVRITVDIEYLLVLQYNSFIC